MTIHLPNDLERSIQAAVQSGHFATEDDAITEIVRDYFRRKAGGQTSTSGVPEANGGLGSIGTMREDAEFLDQAVEEAMQVRENRPWRLGSGE
jgi:Arc/MetJ-type ribon-helix-helix transcriptional regulator